MGSSGINLDSFTPSQKSASSVLLVGNPVDLYDVRLQVGNQVFTALLDSGSSDLILPGTECIGCGPVSTSYKPGTKAQDLRIYDFMTYGVPGYSTGAYGDFFLDEVAVVGLDPVSLVVMSVTASGLQGPKSSIRNGQPMQAILGIGPESGGFLNLHGVGRLGNESYLSAVGKLYDMAGILAVQLCTNNGHMWLGYPNPKHFEADPEYAPIYGSPWFIGMSISLGDQDSLNISNAITLVDTGTNDLLLPLRQYTKFMSIIDPEVDLFDSQGCLRETSLHPADAEWHLPDIVISFTTNFTGPISGKRHKVPASESYMVPKPQADGTSSWCHCVGTSGQGLIIMGAPLMRHFVVIFDMHNKIDPRIGFAPQQNSTCPHLPSPPRPSSPPPPGPVPKPGPSGMHWWKILLWPVAALVAVAGLLLVLEHHHRGPIAWLSVLFGWGDRGVVSIEQKDLGRPLI